MSMFTLLLLGLPYAYNVHVQQVEVTTPYSFIPLMLTFKTKKKTTVEKNAVCTLLVIAVVLWLLVLVLQA